MPRIRKLDTPGVQLRDGMISIKRHGNLRSSIEYIDQAANQSILIGDDVDDLDAASDPLTIYQGEVNRYGKARGLSKRYSVSPETSKLVYDIYTALFKELTIQNL